MLVVSTDSYYDARIHEYYIYIYILNSKSNVLFASTMDLELKKKLVKCYIWSIALYGSETWMLRAVDQKHLESLECGAGEGWKKSVGLIM